MTPERIEKVLAGIEPQRLAVREAAMRDARVLIQSKLGKLNEADVREVLRLMNVDLYRGGLRANRFAPAFIGTVASRIVSQLAALNRWIAALWSAPQDKVYETLNVYWQKQEVPGGGRSLPTTLLYVREPRRFNPMMSSLAQGYQALMKAQAPSGSEAYRVYNEALNALRERYSIPPQAIDIVLHHAKRDLRRAERSVQTRTFEGFTLDSFEFLAQLAKNNHDAWYREHRARFIKFLQRPMRALVSDLERRFIRQVNPHLESEPKSPNTLARMRKNVWSKQEKDVYHTHYWAAFHRPELTKQADFQLFIRIDEAQVSFGMATEDASKEDYGRFMSRMRLHRDVAQRALGEAAEAGASVEPVETLLASMGSVRPTFSRVLDRSAALKKGPRLSDEIEELFKILYPLYALAISEAPTTEIDVYLDELPEPSEEEPDYGLEELLEDTLLGEQEINDIEALLEEKRQLILYGPPGTGKTWLAERLADYLAEPGGEVKLVQFHPSYGYEDFVEGIRPGVDPKTGQVRYRVEPGIFRRFCDEAQKRPKQRFVLIIDEINRGNLPRIFGELLYLLERRGRRIELPTSRHSFAVPENLYLIGTMNTADQSIALVDMALRRRFHFKELGPEPGLLALWLKRHAPRSLWVAQLLSLLNEALLAEGVDANMLVGHSHFMVEQLDHAQVKRIWEHTIFPMLKEYFYGNAEKLQAFQYEEFVSRISESSEEDRALD